MPTLESVKFDTSSLEFIEEVPGKKTWYTEEGDVLSVHYFDVTPDAEADVDSIQNYRAFTRRKLPSLGVVEIESIEVDGCRVIRTILKISQQPTGMAYAWSWDSSFREFSYVIKISCIETGMTGAR